MTFLILLISFALCVEEEILSHEEEHRLLTRLLGEKKVKHLMTFAEIKSQRNNRQLESADETVQLMDDVDYSSTMMLGKQQRELTKMSCNRDYMQLFNLFGRKIPNAYVTKLQDHEFCFTDFSCCTTEHFSHMMKNFAMNINRMRKRFRPFIELLTFFRGEKLRRFIKGNRINPKCRYILHDIRPSGVNLLDDDTFREYQKLILTFISQIKDFVDRKEEMFGNLLCSICSPKVHNFISTSPEDGTLVFQMSTEVCDAVYQQAAFENKMKFIFKSLVRRIADYIECASGLTLQGYSTARMFVYPTQETKLDKTCFNNFSKERTACMEFCSDNINLFKYKQNSQFTRHIRQTLRLFYKVLVDSESTIEELYQDVYGYSFHMGLENQPLVIYSEKSPMALQYNVRGAKMEFLDKGGINPLSTQISMAFWKEVEYIIEKSGKS